MSEFSFTELADMHLIYGLANGNAVLARSLYEERFPNRRIPDRKLFEVLHRRLRETGQLICQRNEVGGPNKNVCTVEMEEQVLEMIGQEPDLSTRQIAERLNVSHTSVWKILKDNNLYPYHLQRVQVLSCILVA